jgi:cytochrome c554/c'-like protein
MTKDESSIHSWEKQSLQGWRSSLARTVSGLSLFLTLSGLCIFLLPFSGFVQHSVVLHTLAGVLFLAPFLAYTFSHLKVYWGYPLTQVKFTGWVAGAMLLVCVISGGVLTWDAAFGLRVTSLWVNTHIVTTFGLMFFGGHHLLTIAMRTGKKSDPVLAGQLSKNVGGHGRAAAGWTAGGLALTVVMSLLITPTSFVNEFPAEYDQDPFQGKGPFAPSLAMTTSGGAYDSASLAGSEGCGTTGCHEQIYAEWQPSAHRYASMDAGFQKIQSVMAAQNGADSTRYCAGCHDPISLFSGTKFIGVENLSDLKGYQEGISCLGCHAIQETDVKGNANYVISQPTRYLGELGEGPAAKFVSDFLIRAYPEKHVETLSRRMFKAPEFCAACHKQFIDEEVNQVGWVQLQNQYDNWKSSRWHSEDEPEKTLECRECHMPLVSDSLDPASGDLADFNRSTDDGKHRSHRFLGANQYMPLLHKLEGAEEHAELIEQWLKGEFEIPEIADRWNEGPVVPMEIEVPAEVIPGENFPLRIHLLNNKVGHDFPTGPLDIIQAWVELEVVNDKGEVIFHSGRVDEDHFVETGTFMMKAEPVDRYGNLIDRHNLWEMVGVRFKRSMFPGAAEMASYDIACPGVGDPAPPPMDEEHVIEVPAAASGTLVVRAKLNYRKFDQYLLNFAFPESGLTSPITVMSTAEATIRVQESTK